MDALVALSQRTVFVPTWRMGDDGYRTVVSSDGVAALPVWLDFDALADAATTFGWALPDGRVAYKEIGARAALGHGLANNLLIVVEMGAEHSMEIEQEEMRLLLAPQARSDSSGPFAGTGRLQSSLMRAVQSPTPSGDPPSGTAPSGAASSSARATTPPLRAAVAPKSVAPPAVTASVRTSRAPSSVPAVQATFGGSAGGVTIAPLQSGASDALLRSLANALRTFPEVEWALLAAVARGPAAPVPTVAVRVDASFRMRVNDIVNAVRTAAASAGAGLDVLLLDDAQLMRLARAAGQPFYPWRR